MQINLDYRKLNAVTLPVTYPLSCLDDVFDTIGQANATIYTKLDFTSAYFQLKTKNGFHYTRQFISV
jgi:hypothetical protein